jgi:hypothetical protein
MAGLVPRALNPWRLPPQIGAPRPQPVRAVSIPARRALPQSVYWVETRNGVPVSSTRPRWPVVGRLQPSLLSERGDGLSRAARSGAMPLYVTALPHPAVPVSDAAPPPQAKTTQLGRVRSQPCRPGLGVSGARTSSACGTAWYGRCRAGASLESRCRPCAVAPPRWRSAPAH